MGRGVGGDDNDLASNQASSGGHVAWAGRLDEELSYLRLLSDGSDEVPFPAFQSASSTSPVEDEPIRALRKLWHAHVELKQRASALQMQNVRLVQRLQAAAHGQPKRTEGESHATMARDATEMIHATLLNEETSRADGVASSAAVFAARGVSPAEVR